MATKRVVRASLITALMIMSAAIAAPAFESDAKVRQNPEQEGSNGGLLASSKPDASIVGSWAETVTVTGGPTFKSLVTYTGDGTLVSNDQGSVVTDPSFPHVFSAGHGIWVHGGTRTFTLTSLQLVSDLNGGLLFVNKIRQTVKLSRSRNTYRAVWTAEFTDPAGNAVASFEGTSEGRRIMAEPPS
jgi:hypothetical protein